MRYTIFFSRLREDLEGTELEGYRARLEGLKERVRATNPGFSGMKSFTAEDGERVTIVRFEDAASQEAWRKDPEHREAQRLGRTDYYETYHLAVCDEVHAYAWSRNGSARHGSKGAGA